MESRGIHEGLRKPTLRGESQAYTVRNSAESLPPEERSIIRQHARDGSLFLELVTNHLDLCGLCLNRFRKALDFLLLLFEGRRLLCSS